MKSAKPRSWATVIALASIPFLAGCGSNKNSSNAPVPLPAPLPGVGGGCVPISSQIPFTGTGIFFDGDVIRGGAIPYGVATGQMVIGGGITGGPYQRTGVDGTISMNIIPNSVPAAAPGAYPVYPPVGIPGGAGNANANGYLQISSVTQQDIYYQCQQGGYCAGYTGTYPGTYPPGTLPMPTTPTAIQMCVSGIAIEAFQSKNQIYNGNVYLYLNNTQHGYKLFF